MDFSFILQHGICVVKFALKTMKSIHWRLWYDDGGSGDKNDDEFHMPSTRPVRCTDAFANARLQYWPTIIDDGDDDSNGAADDDGDHGFNIIKFLGKLGPDFRAPGSIYTFFQGRQFKHYIFIHCPKFRETNYRGGLFSPDLCWRATSPREKQLYSLSHWYWLLFLFKETFLSWTGYLKTFSEIRVCSYIRQELFTLDAPFFLFFSAHKLRKWCRRI